MLEFLRYVSGQQTAVWVLVELQALGTITLPSRYPLLHKSDKGVELLDAEVSTDFTCGNNVLIHPSIWLLFSTHSMIVLIITAPLSGHKYYGRNVAPTLCCVSVQFTIWMNKIMS